MELPSESSRELLKDLFTVRPLIYWGDFLLSAALGWGGFFAFESFRRHADFNLSSTVMMVFLFFLSALSFYRALLFIHELSHIRPSALPGFSWAWNLLCGIPLFIPSFFYDEIHLDHHRRSVFGTSKDAEYSPFAHASILEIVAYALGNAIAGPLVFFARFALLAPLSFLLYPVFPAFRSKVLEYVSSLSIDPLMKKKHPWAQKKIDFLLIESLTTAWALMFFYLLKSHRIDLPLVVHAYATISFGIFLSSSRSLTNHRYTNENDRVLNPREQIEDSVTVEGHWFFTELWAPVGLRYHALHHVYPTLPYHSLGLAHRRLKKSLPQNHIYIQTIEASFFSTFKKLLISAKKNESEILCEN